jgi:ABC-2 type transport system permease protein
MIPVLIRISQISLSRDRVAQSMTFLLPVIFFSIFAMVFGRQSMDNTSRIRVAVADEDHSAASRALIVALRADAGLRVRDSARAQGARAGATPVPIDRSRAESLVRAGDVPIAIVIPAGWGATFPNFTGQSMQVDLLSDPSDPVAAHLFVGILQRAAAVTLRSASAFGSGPGPAVGGAARAPEPMMLVRTRTTEVVGDRKEGRSQMISFYAAGVAVMFLLFSTSSAGGTLLEEQESGTLERVLNTNVGMGGLLAGKWIYLTLLGLMQISVMFLWGALVFGLDLFGHLPGFIVMTVLTAAAAAGFGLVLATACRTRQQLSGIATIVILVMSAMGGSMFPRFLMSEAMQKVGLVTFNAWALDGYIKVFWRETPLVQLWPQLLVLAALTAVFLTAARLFARRWEHA